MALKQGSLQHTRTCRVCAIGLGAGTAAMYDPDTNDELCPTCGDQPRAPDPLGFLGPLPAADADIGASHTPAMSAPPGEEANESPLARELEAGLGDRVRFLHRCKAPNTRGDIDHVIVAPSGVWIVDTKSYWGVVERRDVGNWRTVDHRLYVNGRDQTELVRNLRWQAAAVRAALDPVGLGDVAIHPVLLFIGSSGRWFSKPIEIDGVRSMWTSKLIELAAEAGPLDDVARRAVAAQLTAVLQTAT